MSYSNATSAPHAFGVAANDIETANLETARRYLAAIEADTSGETKSDESRALDFYAPDVEQVEFPNRFVPAGARRDLAAVRDAAVRGRAVMRGQRYQVNAAYASGATVILEVLWVGVLSVPVGALAPGDEMKAHFAVFLEFRDGKIHRQRNYDCFEPF